MPKAFELGFDEQSFIEDFIAALATPGISPISAAVQVISNKFTSCIKQFMVGKLIKAPLVKFDTRGKGRYSTIPELTKYGHDIWYTEIKFSTNVADQVNDISIHPFGYNLIPIDYGYGVQKTHQLKVRSLKKQVDHDLQLNHIRLPGELWHKAGLALETDTPLPQPYIANPAPDLDIRGQIATMAGHRTVSFDHIVSGYRCFCECSRTTHAKMLASAREILDQTGPWAQRTINLLDQASYQIGICHLCVAESLGPEAAALRYGDNLQDFEDSYIDQFVIGCGMDSRTAKAEVQRILGLSRWKKEALMYSIVKELMKDTTILREASPAWLGRQRLDVYLPELNLALEYQGEQHFQSVSLFGGDEGLRKAIERDMLKKKLCDENGVQLIYVNHTEPLNAPEMRQRLKKFINRMNS